VQPNSRRCAGIAAAAAKESEGAYATSMSPPSRGTSLQARVLLPVWPLASLSTARKQRVETTTHQVKSDDRGRSAERGSEGVLRSLSKGAERPSLAVTAQIKTEDNNSQQLQRQRGWS